ncbi:aminotransferase class I/II-fold pyridoxal phosphate-dependent enzyme [Haladaptatus halobius]|uniref:aminotransferase class I/II-fold pyridoxal phosphate-dependent enzyme n=1 Tax=Haladaptatus halobius TaxID=2884875 RepID=UPI001D0B4AC9|nr:aminotransferase class I/II-fold pyridoxal phosphate-dependent enzyme [Haladaptatus halobius]
MNPDSITSVGRVPHGSSDDPTLLDFSANINPRIPSGVKEVYHDALEQSGTYPPDDYPDYRRAAADYVGCAPDEVTPTPGGLAAIRLTIELTVSAGDSVLVPFPSFGEYVREVRLQGATPKFVPYDSVFATNPADHALVIVCNPNNPTGDACDADELRRYASQCRDAGTPLLVDEAFLGFTEQESMAGHPGVIVARSLTKLFGLPGLRAGFAVATGTVGDRLEIARRAWTLGTPAATVGAYSMGCAEFIAETRRRVREERTRMRDALVGRFDVHRSNAPFLLLDVGDRDPHAIVRTARERDVAIRDATTFRGLDSHVRVAVRLPDENDRMLDILSDV